MEGVDLDPEVSTHTPLAGRDNIVVVFFCREEVSTHTPLAGRDGRITGFVSYQTSFY